MTLNNEIIPDAQVAEKNESAAIIPKTEQDLTQKIESHQQNPISIYEKSVEIEDPNWRSFREARKKDREEKQEAIRRAEEKEKEIQALKAAMEAAFSKSGPSVQAYQQYYGTNQGYEQGEENEDERLEKKLNSLLEQREKKYMQEMAEREQREYPQRLAKEFPDFSSVCSQENLDYLDFHYPEISRPFQRLPEGYDKWSDIYHAVKKLIPSHSLAKKEAQRAEINSNKPKSISSPQLTQGQENMRETWQQIEQRRAQRYAEMQKLLKSVG